MTRFLNINQGAREGRPPARAPARLPARVLCFHMSGALCISLTTDNILVVFILLIDQVKNINHFKHIYRVKHLSLECKQNGPIPLVK